MPKIDAPTLAEHRVKQGSSLLVAARETFAELGYGDATFTEIATRAGMARSSLYEYYPTKDALLLAVCRDDLPRWVDALKKAIARARTPRDRIAAWIRVQLKMVAEGQHDLGFGMASGDVGADTREAIAELHAELASPVTEALAAMGWKNERLTASLVQGIVEAAARRIEEGEKASVVIRSAVNLALDGLG